MTRTSLLLTLGCLVLAIVTGLVIVALAQEARPAAQIRQAAGTT